MFVARTNEEVRRARAEFEGSLGFVPTMGYLHQGHGSLIERAKAENDHAALSLFVNPIQFGPGEDLATYPRDLERDLALAEKANADLVFVPEAIDFYPKNFSSFVEVEEISSRWEGERRPGHYRGVTTVVAKLFHLLSPTRSYFGDKDYQQLQVIRKMVEDLNWGIEVVGCEIVREPDGLAMSSRNAYLDPESREIAPLLYRTLSLGRQRLASGETSVAVLLEAMEKNLRSSPFRLDYLAIVDPESLAPVARVDRPARMLVAAYLGKVRLIDNLELSPEG